MIRRQLVNFGGFGCDYRIGAGALDEFSRLVSGVVGTPHRAALIRLEGEDETVLERMRRGLIDAGFSVFERALGPVESFDAACSIDIQGFLADSGVTHDDIVVGVGDMALCSLVSYVAYSWCGGTACVLVPTSLEAMAMAATTMDGLSVSGRRGIVSLNPRVSLVVNDLDLVMAAPFDRNAVGIARLLAAALAESRRSWETFGSKISGFLAGEEIAYIDVLGMAQTAWSGVIKASNPSSRKAFNYGMFSARALRACLGDSVPWQVLVAEGMRFEARLAHDACGLDLDVVFEQDDRLADLGFEAVGFSLASENFIDALKREAYRTSNRFMFSLPKCPGSIRLCSVDEDLLERHAGAYLASCEELL